MVEVRTIILRSIPSCVRRLMNGIVVLVGIVAHGVADAVGYVVLQPALLDGQHLVEGVGNVEAYRIHLLVHHILLNLFRRQPALVGESELQLVPVELEFFAEPSIGRNFR